MYVSILASNFYPVHIDVHAKKNMEEHSTIFYDTPGLVLRRGQSFSSTITMNDEFRSDQCQLSLIVRSTTWPTSLPIRIPFNGKSNDGWSIQCQSSDNEKKNRLCLEISSPSNALIGKYSVRQ
jgi:hypothetical protein